ncbi:Ycf48-like protein precursor [Pseudoalteromonas sp. P1-13-1a]|uniref:WD40/YVTN/BNR-like repeat-containing protein n=1 Tax=Pseudoalteromonas sp. P1-13-1a TaxID=1723756 RepID=UPI0006D671B2|nr:YCF48-related protein [Pseudoalteromonas sp. P1-13-1a]KPZ54703.1 Ycf48-like protein precursor [Pseudoalteromonas sp. P1-13-1a]
MKYLVYASLIISGASVAQDAPQYAISAINANKTLLTDITHTGASLVAVGKHGTVITSKNAEQWQQAQTVPTQVLLTAVDFSNETHGWACGHDATIINTTDGGLNWQLQQAKPELDKPCLDIYFEDDSKGFAVGAYGMFYQTSDGGKHWQKRFLDSLLFSEDREYLNDLKDHDPEGYEAETASILPHFNRIEKTDSGLMLVGEMGLMAKSTDNGQTWQRLDEIYPGSFFAVASDSDQEIVAGLRGNVFAKNKNEQRWQHFENVKTATVNNIINYNNAHWLLLANSGVIFHLKDGLLTHEQRPDGKAILDGVIINNKLVMATEDGIKVKELNP